MKVCIVGASGKLGRYMVEALTDDRLIHEAPAVRHVVFRLFKAAIGHPRRPIVGNEIAALGQKRSIDHRETLSQVRIAAQQVVGIDVLDVCHRGAPANDIGNVRNRLHVDRQGLQLLEDLLASSARQ